MEYLEKLCCLLLLGKVFLHMCPGAVYEKYLSALLSWIMLLLLLVPFAGKNISGEGYEDWKKVYEEMLTEEKQFLEEESQKISITLADEAKKESGE